MYDRDAEVRRVTYEIHIRQYKRGPVELQYREFYAFAHLSKMDNWNAERDRVSVAKTCGNNWAPQESQFPIDVVYFKLAFNQQE